MGEVTRVDPTLLRSLVDSGYIPVVATVATDEGGQALNVNADTAAGEIAAALRAEKLILMTDVPGVLRDKDDVSTKFAELNIKTCRELTQEGIIAGGMIPKVRCCKGVLQGGAVAWEGRSRMHLPHLAMEVCSSLTVRLLHGRVPWRTGPVLRAVHQPGRERHAHHRRAQPPLHPYGAAYRRGRGHHDHRLGIGLHVAPLQLHLSLL